MLDTLRRYGLDKWGPLTCVALFVIAVVVVTIAVLVLVTRPSVDEVIKAGQALATGAVAIAGIIAGHGFLRGQREVADAHREAAAMIATGEPAGAVVDPATDEPDKIAGGLPSDEEELATAPALETAERPDAVPGAHGLELGEEPGA